MTERDGDSIESHIFGWLVRHCERVEADFLGGLVRNCEHEKMKQEKEMEVVSKMIRLYCAKNHGANKGVLCAQCRELLEYVQYRRSVCPFSDNKLFCSNCKIHCYKSEMREQIRVVMRFSGPRLILKHPIVTLRHILQSKKEKRKMKVRDVW